MVPSQMDDLRAIVEEFDFSLIQAKNLMQEYLDQLMRGLESDGNMLKCLPSFVYNLPTGQERGLFLLVDLGGSNLRVGLGKLLGNNDFEFKELSQPVPECIKEGSGHNLISYIASSVQEFAANEVPAQLAIEELGFTFSFPVEQESLHHGRIIQFNKGYRCDDIIGMDVVQLLESELSRIGLPIKVKALVNDTVAALMAHAYRNPKTRISCIIGTGTNGAYYESHDRISKLPPSGPGMIINVEWGGFGDGEPVVLPINRFDELLMEDSEAPGKQRFEKMVSGMYLGELFRLVGSKLNLLQDSVKPYDISTDSICNHDFQAIKSFLASEVANDQCLINALQDLARAIVRRSARLSACLIAATLSRYSETEEIAVSIDGPLFAKNPQYQKDMHTMLAELLETKRYSQISLETGTGEPLIGTGIIIASNQ